MADAPRPDLLEFLLARGAVTPAQLEEARRSCPHPEDVAAVLDELAARGILEPAELAALRSSAGLRSTAGNPRTALYPPDLNPEIPRPADGDHEWAKWAGPEAGPRRLGRFEILGVLGRGGMGMVLKAHDPQLGRTVAIKGIQGAVTGLDDPLAQRFRREARAAARVRHPSIIPIHEVGESDGQAYLVMEYIEGRPLTEHLRASGGGPVEGARLLAQVADALAAAHREGVLHRDLKPDNIMVDGAGRPYVVDFGLARDVVPDAGSRITITGEVIGTPNYMAPEQAEGRQERVGPRTDVYGLGAVLYEVLAGRPPFEAADMNELLLRVSTVEPRPPSRLRADVPRDLERICLQCLAKEPERRYAGAAEVAQDLARFLRGEPVLARRAGSADRALRWAVRRRRVWLAAAALLLAAVGLVAWGRFARERAAQRAQALLERIAVAVRGLEDAVRRTPLTTEARAELERQPLGLLEELIDQDRGLGAAYSWRGEVHALAGRSGEAGADFDRGCALAPDQPIVWCLRGLDRISRYARLRGLPQAILGPGGVRLRPAPDSRPEVEALRTAGLADLERLTASAHSETSLDAADLRVGRALAALHSGGGEGHRRALAELEGLARPAALAVRATTLYHLGKFAESVTTYEELLGAWPEDVDAWTELGQAQMAAALASGAAGGDPRALLRKAVADFDQALRRDDGALQARNRRCIARVALGQDEELRGADPRECFRAAVEDGRQGVKRAPSAAAYLNLGNALVFLGRAEAMRGADPRNGLREAVAALDQAVRGAPDSALALNARAQALTDLARAEAARGVDSRDNLRRALADAEAGKTKDPESGWACVALGVARSELALQDQRHGSDPREALRRATEDYGEALRRDPDLTLVHENLARTLYVLGQAEAARGGDPLPSWRRAVSECGERLGSAAGDVETLSLRVHLRADAGRTEALAGKDAGEWFRLAQADAGEAVRLGPDSPVPFEARGGVHFTLAQVETAVGADPGASLQAAMNDYSAALQRNPAFQEALLARGTSHWMLGQRLAAGGGDPRAEYRLACADAAAVIDQNPSSAAAFNNRGLAGLFLADAEGRAGGDERDGFARAIEDCTRALALDPSLLPALNNRASAHLGLGMARARRHEDPGEEYARAEEDYRAAIAKHNVNAWLNLGLLLRTIGRFTEAIDAFETGGRAMPARAAWVRQRIEETRAQMRQAEAEKR